MSDRPERIDQLQLACPKCGEPERWRARWIGPHHFTADCRKCEHSWESRLPDLDTKLIALDTNAVSELMKVANPNYPAARRARVPALWKEILDRLDRASRLQAVACPRSPTIERESLLFQYGPAIEETAKRFDSELWCHPLFNVRDQQLNLAAKAYNQKQPVRPLPRALVYGGKLNQWSNWFRIEVDMGYGRNPPDQVRKARDAGHTRAGTVFDRWSRGKATFEQVFNDERRAMGIAMVERYIAYLRKLQSGEEQPFQRVDKASHSMAMIRYGLEEPGGDQPSLEKQVEFALTEDAANIPCNRIRAALYAYEARQMAGGMRSPSRPCGATSR